MGFSAMCVGRTLVNYSGISRTLFPCMVFSLALAALSSSSEVFWSWASKVRLVRRQKPIFGLKCAISGNNHLFAFFDSSWYVDKILPGWELAIGLAFSESKMAARMGETYIICRSEHICCSRHATMTIFVSKCMFLMMRNPMLWLLN